MTEKGQPIGYWLKHCHDLLTRLIDMRQGAHGVSRTGWQVLNVVRDGGADPGTVPKVLAPFAGPEELDAVLAGLRRQGLVDACLELTDEGRDAFQEFQRTQDRVRETVTKGIGREEYEITIAVLEKIAHNLEAAAPAEGEATFMTQSTSQMEAGAP